MFFPLNINILDIWITCLKKEEPEWNWIEWEGDAELIVGFPEMDEVLQPCFIQTNKKQ